MGQKSARVGLLYSRWGYCPINCQVFPTNFVLCPTIFCQISSFSVFKANIFHHRLAKLSNSKTFWYFKGVCLLHLSSENILHVLRCIWFYVLMKQKWTWNLSLYYFGLFCFYSCQLWWSNGWEEYSTWRRWYKQTLRVYYSRWPISWLIPEMQFPVIYIIKFSNN